MVAVSNSTPLIALSKIGKLNLLREYFEKISIPKAVYDEVVVKGGVLYGAEEVAEADWIMVEDVGNSLAVESLSIYLDAGEPEAIVLAKENNCLLIIDDGDGRKTASNMNMDITGTVGILLKAGRDGKIDLRESLDELNACGFRLSDKVRDFILSKVEE
jgi:predicted nucleic acid-binding protein